MKQAINQYQLSSAAIVFSIHQVAAHILGRSLRSLIAFSCTGNIDHNKHQAPSLYGVETDSRTVDHAKNSSINVPISSVAEFL